MEEPFRAGTQKGSQRDAAQAQPGEVPSSCAGSPGCCAANLQAGLENVALWHERDISHSSVERIILPDSLHARLLRAGQVPRRSSKGMHVYPERMLENLDASYGLVFSQPVLLALVEAGMTRDDAYRIVQRNAMRTWEERRPFLEVLREDADVVTARSATPGSRPASTCTAALANVGRTFDGARRRLGRAPGRAASTEADRERHLAPAPYTRQGPRALRGRTTTAC